MKVKPNLKKIRNWLKTIGPYEKVARKRTKRNTNVL